MEAPYLQGVHYLSREEEAVVRDKRRQKENLPDVSIHREDTFSLEFMQNVRTGIEAWKAGKQVCFAKHIFDSSALIASLAETRGLLECTVPRGFHLVSS